MRMDVLTQALSFRHRPISRTRTDNLKHQRLSSSPGDDQEHSWTLRRRPASRGREWEADDHERWRDSHEGLSLPSSQSHTCHILTAIHQLLDIVHPAARILTDIARSQDAEVGDGTTSVVVLAGEILKEIKEQVEQGVSSQIIIKGLRRACGMAVNKIKEIAVSTSEGNQRDTLRKLAATAMSSKLIHRNADFFTKSKAFFTWGLGMGRIAS